MKLRPAAALCRIDPAQPAASESPRPARPDVAGISAERLDRLHQRLRAFVDRGELAGLVTLVAREGKVVDQWAGGMQDREKRQPMRPDAIFRIASMTKPVTSVAVMMLYEEGRLLLTDRLSKYVPAFGDRQRPVQGRRRRGTEVAARETADHPPRPPDPPLGSDLRVLRQGPGGRCVSRASA